MTRVKEPCGAGATYGVKRGGIGVGMGEKRLEEKKVGNSGAELWDNPAVHFKKFYKFQRTPT